MEHCLIYPVISSFTLSCAFHEALCSLHDKAILRVYHILSLLSKYNLQKKINGIHSSVDTSQNHTILEKTSDRKESHGCQQLLGAISVNEKDRKDLLRVVETFYFQFSGRSSTSAIARMQQIIQPKLMDFCIQWLRKYIYFPLIIMYNF